MPQSFWNNAIATFAANDEIETPTETPKSQTPKTTTQGSDVTAAQVLGYEEARGRVEAKLNLK